MPTFTANKSGITFTRAATDVDMKLSTTDTNLWGITNFTVTFKGGTTYTYDESSTDSGAKDNQIVNLESKASGTTTTFKFTFKGDVTINGTGKIYTISTLKQMILGFLITKLMNGQVHLLCTE